MDPLTQGVFGSLFAQAAAKRDSWRPVAAAGFLAGMAPDLDVLIRSPEDALLALDYHRHFTHAVAFAPLGALVVALALWPVFRRYLGIGRLYLACLLGFLSHGFLDAFTSYGTHLWWPFADTRVAWSWISVIDPLFSVPLALLAAVAVSRRRRLWHGLAVAWAALYLGFGAFQHHRAEAALQNWVDARGIEPRRLLVKPAFANVILWRGLVDEGDHLRAVAIRQVPFGAPRFYPGERVEKLLPSALDGKPTLARDLERFAVFSDRWLFRYRPEESTDTWFVGDFRYAIDPASGRPLWGIEFSPSSARQDVAFERLGTVSEDERRRFFRRLLGK